MSCLHTINGSPESALLNLCGSVLVPGDGILFLEDGTYYCAVKGAIPKLHDGIELFVLKEDMIARGTLDELVAGIELANYTRFVDLACEFEKVGSWFQSA